jgi:ethanolamine ammonia-lyase small subunit
LPPDERERVSAQATAPSDIAIVIADGLSSAAVQANAAPFLGALLPRLHEDGLTLSPISIVLEGRVAIGDEIGALLRARMVLVLIGERPGLSAADSLGAYSTRGPAVRTQSATASPTSGMRASIR